MKLLRAILRIVRLPVDFLFLTLDFARIVVWSLWAHLTRLVGLPTHGDDPLHRGGDVLPTGERDCPRARKYGTLGVFRLICPLARQTEGRAPACTFQADDPQEAYWPSWLRRGTLGTALIAMWVGVVSAGAVGWRQLPFVQRWREQERVSRVGAEPGEPSSPSASSSVSLFPQPGKPTKVVASRERASTDRVRENHRARDQATTSPRSVAPVPATPEPDATARGRRAAKAEVFVNSGDVYLAQKRYPEAIIEYKNAIQQDRSSARARLGLGLSYLHERRWREARYELSEAVRLDPTLAEAHAQLCRAELARRDVATAAKHARQVKQLKRDDPEGYVLLSACLQAQDDWDAAEKEVRAATQLGGATADTFFRAGSLYWRRDDMESAGAAYRAALEIDDTHVDARIGLAGVLRAKRELDAARQEIDIALQADPAHAGAAIELAEWHAAKGQVKEAIATYERLAKDQPKLYEARARLAWLLVRSGRANDGVAVAAALVNEAQGHVLGHFVLAQTFHAKQLYDMAMSHCEQALATNRAHQPTRVLLARCHQAKQRHEDAVREFERVLRASPKHSRARLLLAQSHLDLKQHDRAKQCYEQVAKDNPTSPMPHLGLAQVHAARGLPEAALLCYEEALKLAPGNPLATNNLATTLLELGRDLDRAHGLAADLRKRFPASPIFADTYGWICYHRGEYQKAINALAFAAERWPRVADLRYHYGMALFKAGQSEQARQELTAALKLSQEFDGAEEARAMLAEQLGARDLDDQGAKSKPAHPEPVAATVVEPTEAESTVADGGSEQSASNEVDPAPPPPLPIPAMPANTAEVTVQTDGGPGSGTPVADRAPPAAAVSAEPPRPVAADTERVAASGHPERRKPPAGQMLGSAEKTPKESLAPSAESLRASYPSRARLEQAPRGKGHGNQYARGLGIVIESGGTPTEYDVIMGLTGLAFIIQAQDGQPLLDGAVNVGQWPLASWGFLQRLDFLGKCLGWTIGRIERDLDAYQADPGKHYREYFDLAVRESITNRQPLLAIQNRCFVVRGYDDGHPPLLGNWSDTDAAEDLRIPAHPWVLIRLGARQPSTEQPNIDREALRYAVALFRDEGPSERYTGRRSFELWIRALRDTDHLGQSRWHADMVRHLRINRSSASAYLSAMAKRHPANVAQHLAAAASQYRKELALLYGADTSKVALVVRPAGREKLAGLIERLVRTESEAIAAIEGALAEMGE